MELVRNTRSGKDEGKVSVLRTIATMDEGEEWTTSTAEIDYDYAMVCCSRYGRKAGKSFSVSSPAALEGKIIITRNR